MEINDNYDNAYDDGYNQQYNDVDNKRNVGELTGNDRLGFIRKVYGILGA